MFIAALGWGSPVLKINSAPMTFVFVSMHFGLFWLRIHSSYSVQYFSLGNLSDKTIAKKLAKSLGGTFLNVATHF